MSATMETLAKLVHLIAERADTAPYGVSQDDLVLAAMSNGHVTWDALRRATGLKPDPLSEVVARLYERRKIRPVTGAEERTYRLI